MLSKLPVKSAGSRKQNEQGWRNWVIMGREGSGTSWGVFWIYSPELCPTPLLSISPHSSNHNRVNYCSFSVLAPRTTVLGSSRTF